MARYIPCAPREPLSRLSFGPILVWIEPRRFCRGLNVEGVAEEQRVSCQEGAGSAVTASVSSSSRFLFLSPLGDSCGCPSVRVRVSSPLISDRKPVRPLPRCHVPTLQSRGRFPPSAESVAQREVYGCPGPPALPQQLCQLPNQLDRASRGGFAPSVWVLLPWKWKGCCNPPRHGLHPRQEAPRPRACHCGSHAVPRGEASLSG